MSVTDCKVVKNQEDFLIKIGDIKELFLSVTVLGHIPFMLFTVDSQSAACYCLRH